MSDPTTPTLDLAELRRLAVAMDGPCVSLEVRRAWADVAHPATLLTLLDRLEAAEAEVAALRERDALALLDAWQQANGKDWQVRLNNELRGWRVELCRYPYSGVMYCIAYSFPGASDLQRVYLGTDDKPATLAECILAALDLWQQRYGEQAEA